MSVAYLTARMATIQAEYTKKWCLKSIETPFFNCRYNYARLLVEGSEQGYYG